MNERRSLFEEKEPQTALVRAGGQNLSAEEDQWDQDNWEENEEEEEEEEQPPEEPEQSASAGIPASVAPLINNIAPPVASVPSRERSSREELTIEDILARADANREYDIFEDVGQPLVDKGDRVTYSIKKNGAHKGSVPHPFSYDQIQKKWGGGSYQVTLRSYYYAKKPGGGYLRSQTKMVDGPETINEPIAHAAPPERESPMEMLTLLQTMNEKSRAEQKAELDRIREDNRVREERLEKEANARELRLEKEGKEREQKAEKEGASTLMIMMKMMQQSSEAQQNAAQRQSELMLALLTGKQSEKKDDKSDKMFDTLMAVLLDKKGKGEGLDPLELQKLLSEERDRGYEQAKEIRELAKEEAARMNGRPYRDDDEEEQEEKPEEESTTKLLLRTMAPALAHLISQPAPAQLPPPVRALPPPQSRVNPNIPARPAPQPMVQRTAPPMAPRPMAPPAPRATAPMIPQTPQPRVMMQPAPSPVAPRVQPIAVGAPPKAPAAENKGSLVPQDKKKIVSDLVIDAIGADLAANILTGAFNPEGTADKSLDSLKSHGIDAAWLDANFTLDEMKVVAKSKGVPDAVHPYLERFHTRVKAVATTKTLEVRPTV